MKQQSQESLLAFFDKDGDGKISAAELCLFLSTVRREDLSNEEAGAMIRSMDANAADGLLPLDQLVFRLLEAEAEAEVEGDNDQKELERDLREAFRMYENEGEDCITARSLKRMFSRLGVPMGMEQCRAMICRLDTDGDDILCFDEFKFMMMMMP